MPKNIPGEIQTVKPSLATAVGTAGSMAVDTDTVRVHDGVTPGGHPLMNTTTAQMISGEKTFTTSPTVPTQTANDNSTKAASTAYVDRAVAGIDYSGVPYATKTSAGFVKIGAGLVVKDGVISRVPRRNVYRHDTLPGSVIEYDNILAPGTISKMLVADAAYRMNPGRVQNPPTKFANGAPGWAYHYVPVSDVNQIYPQSSSSSITGIVDLTAVASLDPYAEKLTDAWFHKGIYITSGIFSAAAGTYFIRQGQSGGNAPDYTINCLRCCVSLGSSVVLNIPNIFQLFVIYAESDRIDALDPTVSANPSLALGMYGSNTERWLNGSEALSSTEYSDGYMSIVSSGGGAGAGYKAYNHGVIPIAEL